LSTFLRDCLSLGCLKGFKLFSLYLRGREELLVTIGSTDNTQKKDVDEFGGSNNVVFLVGAYARYKCPFVWVRSNHTQLPSGKPTPSKDTPIELRTTAVWKTENIRLWDVIAEIVPLAFSNPAQISNPFEVDREFFQHLSPLDRFLNSGALLHFLKRIYLATDALAQLVLPDLQWLSDFHFANLPKPSPLPAPTTTTSTTTSHSTTTSS